MANGLEVITIKQRVLSDIVNNDNIIRLIDENCIGEGDSLMNKNFFQFFRVPYTEEEAQTYICCEVNIPNLNPANTAFREVLINIWVISHQDLLITPLGTRIDLIGWEIEKMFNGNDTLGIGEAVLSSNIEDSITKNHRCRRLQFSVSDLNKGMCDV